MVASGIMASRRIGGDMPEYPAIAKAAQIQGTVVLHATISKEGTIQDLRVISGPPMLQQAATDAARTWTYKPYLLNGEPVAVQTQINIIFNLGSVSPAGLMPEGGAAPPQANGPTVHTVQVQVTPPPQTTDSPTGGSPPPAHPITTEQVHELMQLTGAINLTKQMLDGMMPALRHSMPPYMPNDVLDDFETSLLGADFEAMLVRTYQAHLSADDATAIIAFYKTPSGQHMLAAMPQIAKESQTAGQQLGEQVMMQVLQRHQAEIEAAKEKYDLQHPWSAPRN
jgi:TonB family protein